MLAFASRSVSRAGSPLLFGLAPRGVFRASCVAARAVGSYPTFSPLPAELALEDVSQVSLFDVTELRSAGGLFSVALSVASLHRIPTEPERCTPSVQLCLTTEPACEPPGVTRRAAHFSDREAAPRGSTSRRNGVRTFLPPRSCSARL
jgi:hypothetical protein